MNVQLEKLGGNMVALKIEVEAERFEKACRNEYIRTRFMYNVPGFRKGRAPQKVIEKVYGENFFFERVVRNVIDETFAEALKETGIEAAGQAELRVETLQRGCNAIYTAIIPSFVDVTLGQYKGIRLTTRDLSVSDEEVAERIREDLRRAAEENIVTDRPVENGDVIYLDFEGFMDGVAFEGGYGENYRLEIGSNTFIPGFEEQLIGVMPGEKPVIQLTFPEDYSNDSLAGKEAEFRCCVHRIAEMLEPALDDEFAKDQGCDSLEEYKAGVKALLENKKAEEAEASTEQEVFEKICDASELEIPESVLTLELDQMRRELEESLGDQGLSIEMYLQYLNMTEEELNERNKPAAISGIKTRVLLQAVADAEGVTVSEADYNEEYRRLSEQFGRSEAEIRGVISDRELEKNLLMRKVVRLILDSAIFE